jgi:hypothetical protein
MTFAADLQNSFSAWPCIVPGGRRPARCAILRRCLACHLSRFHENFPHWHFLPAMRALIDSDLPSRRDIESLFANGRLYVRGASIVTQVTAAEWPSSFKNPPYPPTRFWRGCPMRSSSKGWPQYGIMATRSTRKMPLPRKSIGLVFTRSS